MLGITNGLITISSIHLPPLLLQPIFNILVKVMSLNLIFVWISCVMRKSSVTFHTIHTVLVHYRFFTDMFTISSSLPTAAVANSSTNPCNDDDALRLTDGDFWEKENLLLQSHVQSQPPEGHLFHKMITSLSCGAPPHPSSWLLSEPQAFGLGTSGPMKTANAKNWALNPRSLSKKLSSGLEIKFHIPWCHLFLPFFTLLISL